VSAGVNFEEVVFRAIDRVNELLPDSSALAKSPDEPLAGLGGKLDSMGIVNFMVAVEDEVAQQCGVELTLADVRGNGASDPLETVGSLVNYLRDTLDKP
jgi:acyl carrier protein